MSNETSNETSKETSNETSNETGINIKVVTVTMGIVGALYLLVISIIAMSTEVYGHNIAELIMTVYPGYALNFFGVVLGMGWAFVDGAIFGALFSFIYNQVLKCPCLR
jgi:hypothetical protein